jgi:L-seryl-tRNA(Ser) seleniumtransferase
LLLLHSQLICENVQSWKLNTNHGNSVPSLRSGKEKVTTASQSDLYRQLPSVDELLKSDALAELLAREGQSAVTESVRYVLASVRTEINSGTLATQQAVTLAVEHLPRAVARHLSSALEFSLKPVINATGVVLHTNLGRAPLAESAIRRIAEVAGGYSNLEFDIGTGERGKRDVHVERLFSRLLNQEGVSGIRTVVVNNCAAAVMLALNTLAEGGEVIVSRGELVEIGGSFRVPDVMAKSGAVLREVGTTNRTRLADYENAITEKTRLLLRVHRSNFAIIGFTEQPSLEELAALGHRLKIPVMEDLGGGAMIPLRSLGVNESGVMDSLRAGADLLTYSGDKMLGGPQAGLLSGREDLIKRVRSNPLFRALRVDKLTYAALEGTLMEYIRRNHDAIPFARMMRLSAAEIRVRAEALQAQLSAATRLNAQIIAGESLVGGGSAPTSSLPTFLLAITAQSFSADELATRLRGNDPPIVTRVEEGRVLLDLRTVMGAAEEAGIVRALLSVAN